jgi:hypothetical protein
MTFTGTGKRLLTGIAAITTAAAVLLAPVAANAAPAVATKTDVAAPNAVKYPAWLKPGQTLNQGHILVSPKGTYKLTMQRDGNLVMYKKTGKTYKAVWHTNTHGRGPGVRAVMQTDGNFVLYKAKTAIWNTRTKGGMKGIVVQDDGNLVMYSKANKPIWWRNIIVVMPYHNTKITAGMAVVSYNRKFTFAMQADGNLVLYKGKKALWASKTTVRGSYAVSQVDGNFVIYQGKRAIWSTNTAGNKGAYLVVQDDGNVVIYRKDKKPVWHTGTRG